MLYEETSRKAAKALNDGLWTKVDISGEWTWTFSKGITKDV